MKESRSIPIIAMAVCLVWACVSVNAQQAPDVSLGQIFTDSTLWGKDFPGVLAFLPSWDEIGEREVVVFADRVLGATDFDVAAEAEPRVAALAEAMAYLEAPPQFRAELIAFAEADTQRVGWQVPSMRLLAEGLTMQTVRERLGPPDEVTQQVVQGEGERRPAVLTGLSYAGGAAVFIETDLAPRPGFVDRVTLNMPAVVAAMAEEE